MNKSEYLIFEMVCSEHFADVDFETSDISAKSKLCYSKRMQILTMQSAPLTP